MLAEIDGGPSIYIYIYWTELLAIENGVQQGVGAFVRETSPTHTARRRFALLDGVAKASVRITLTVTYVVLMLRLTFSKTKNQKTAHHFEAYHEWRRRCQLFWMSKQHCFHCRCLLLEDMIDLASNMASAVHRGGVACSLAVLVLRREHRAHSVCEDYRCCLG